MSKTRRVAIEIDRCYHVCPYFGLDGGPSPTMVCNHPEAPMPYIVSHPECDDGFPEKCPLESTDHT